MITKEQHNKLKEMLILEKEELFAEGTRLFILGTLVGVSVGMCMVMIIQNLIGKV